MTNNDVIRQIRETFDFSDATMIKIFSLADKQVSRTEIGNWLKREHDPAFKMCYDDELAAFLNGLIINMRGPKDGSAAVAEQKLSNNLILKKIKIALDLKAEDLRDIIALTGSSVSNYELSAFFRKPDHKNYRPLRNRLLRNFFEGMQLKYRAGQ